MKKLEEILKITNSDLLSGKRYYKYEQVRPINRDNIFLTFVYSVLSQREHFSGLKIKFDKILEAEFTTPESVLDNKRKVKRILNCWESKYNGIISLSEWFIENTIDSEIIHDALNSRKDEFNIRDKIAENAPRISYKTASLVLMKLGYGQVVPLDINARRFLESYLKKEKSWSKKWRFLNEQYNGIISGIRTSNQYFVAEELFRSIAKKYCVKPVILHSAIYIKDSKESRHLKQFKK